RRTVLAEEGGGVGDHERLEGSPADRSRERAVLEDQKSAAHAGGTRAARLDDAREREAPPPGELRRQRLEERKVRSHAALILDGRARRLLCRAQCPRPFESRSSPSRVWERGSCPPRRRSLRRCSRSSISPSCSTSPRRLGRPGSSASSSL